MYCETQNNAPLPLMQNTVQLQWQPESFHALVDGIGSVDQVTEESFLDLGERVQSFHRRASCISEVAGDVLNLLKGEGGESALQSLQLLVERCHLWLNESNVKSSANSDSLKNVLAQINELDLPILGLRKVVKTLHSLRVSTRIEAAKGYAAGAAVLAKSLDELGAMAQGRIVEITERTELLIPVIHRSVEMEELVQTNAVRVARQEIEKARQILGRLLETCIETGVWTDRLKDCSVNVTENFGEMIAALQFQDITRQRLDHVNRALGKLGQQMDAFCQRTDFSKDNEAEKLFANICKLQHDQLDFAVHEFVKATESLSVNLQSMAASIISMAGDTKELARLSEGDADHSFAAILAALNSIASHLTEASHTHHLAESNLAEVNAGIREISELVAEVEFIGEEMQLLAVNAAINAAHAQQKGAGLEVIAESIQEVAEEACQHALILAKYCNEVTVQAQQLQNVDLVTQSDVNDVNSLLQEAQGRMKRLEGAHYKLVEHAGNVDREAIDLSGEVSLLVHNINIGATFKQKLTPVLERLKLFSKLSGEELNQTESTNLEWLFKELELCYTMASEREVHQHVVGGQDFASQKMTAEEDEWTADRQHDLGDNVDLF